MDGIPADADAQLASETACWSIPSPLVWLKRGISPTVTPEAFGPNLISRLIDRDNLHVCDWAEQVVTRILACTGTS